MLIVDDDAVLARTLCRVLQGQDVAVVSNGRDALEVLLSGRPFDVILCDLMMPVMTGMELHANVAEKLPHPFDARNLRAIVQRAARLRVASA